MARCCISNNQVLFFYPTDDGKEANGIVELYTPKTEKWDVTLWLDRLDPEKVWIGLNPSGDVASCVRREDATNIILQNGTKAAIKETIQYFQIHAFRQLSKHIGQGTVVLQGYP